jgi:hypothetical protein
VQRLELWMSLFAGASGGLLGMLWHGLVSVPWLSRTSSDWSSRIADQTLAELCAAALIRTGAGVVLGGFFWASWGLIAFVRVPWYFDGLAFGLLCWAGVAFPTLATLRVPARLAARPVLVHTVEWLATCLAVGLCCAYAWHLSR